MGLPVRSVSVAGHRLQVTGYRLQATGYRLQDTGYRPSILLRGHLTPAAAVVQGRVYTGL